MTQKASPFTQNHKIHRLRIDSALESGKNIPESPQKYFPLSSAAM